MVVNVSIHVYALNEGRNLFILSLAMDKCKGRLDSSVLIGQQIMGKDEPWIQTFIYLTNEHQ